MREAMVWFTELTLFQAGSTGTPRFCAFQGAIHLFFGGSERGSQSHHQVLTTLSDQFP